MSTLNSKFLNLCKKNSCFKLVPFIEKDFLTYNYNKPQEFFINFWNKYELFKKKFKSINKKEINNSFNGAALEIILAYLFTRENIQIYKMDENIDIKFVKPDFILIGKSKKKFFISVKVSLRERWKQADWEAIKYKDKYPNSKCFLVINNKKEYNSMKEKIEFLSLDNVFFANSNDLNEMINLIKN